MIKLLFFLISFLGMLSSYAQTLVESQYKNLQDLEKNLQQSNTPEQKTDAFISLYIYHSRHNEPFNRKAAEEYQQQLEIFTHNTRKPELIAKALFYLSRILDKEESKKRIERFTDYVKLHQLDFYKALAKIREAEHFFGFSSERNLAQQSLSESLNLAKNLNDSLKALIFIEAGFRHLSINNHLQALQLAFDANEIAFRLRSDYLSRASNGLFATVYVSLNNYNKAIEYYLKETELFTLLENKYSIGVRHARIAGAYFMTGQPILGNYHLEAAYRFADSANGSKRMYNEITGLVLGYLSRSENNEVLEKFIKKYRQHFFIFPNSGFVDNYVLAGAFLKIGNMDSARLLIKRSEEYKTDQQSMNSLKQFYFTLAGISARDKNWELANQSYKKSVEIALTQNNLSESIQYVDSLKIILAKQNLYPEAFQYSLLRDSLQKEFVKQLNKEDITRQEVAALEKEKEMEAVAKEKEKKQRHNVQYLGITFGVVVLFISLLLMGIFKVSPRTIKILSFFSFLLFFEFIFLIFKKQISVFTHGEPLKDLAFMVLLAAVMVPLHHWGEHRVVNYLSTNKFSFRNKAFFRNGNAENTKAKKEMEAIESK